VELLINLNNEHRKSVWWVIAIVFAATFGFNNAVGMSKGVELLYSQVLITLISLFVVQTYNDVTESVYKWFDSAVALVTSLLTLTCIVPVYIDVGASYLTFCTWLTISLLVFVWAILLEDDSQNSGLVPFVLLTLSIVAQIAAL
jgi:hypothetical protein